MEYRQLVITIVSAKGLKKVKDVPEMKVYLEAYLSTNPNAMQMTPYSNVGGNDPEWNFTMQFTVNEAAIHQKNAAFLMLRPKCVRRSGGDKEMGECQVPLNELFEKAAGKDYKSHNKATYSVKKPKSGKEKGELKFTFMFGDMFVSLANNTMPQPTMITNPYAPPAYQQPPPPPPQMAAYPPPPTAYLPAPASFPPAGYPPAGYPPAGYTQQGQRDLPNPVYYPAAGPAYGYGYAPPVVQQQQQQQSSDGDMALAMGAAFVGGMVDGMVLSDAAYAAGD